MPRYTNKQMNMAQGIARFIERICPEENTMFRTERGIMFDLKKAGEALDRFARDTTFESRYTARLHAYAALRQVQLAGESRMARVRALRELFTLYAGAIEAYTGAPEKGGAMDEGKAGRLMQALQAALWQCNEKWGPGVFAA